MTEECVVSKIKGSTAYISLTQKEKCGGCKACTLWRSKKVSLPAVMDVSCTEGDTVIVEMPKKDTPFTLLLFIIPLVFLALGFVVGGYIGGGGDIARLLTALGFCVVSFAAAVPIERHFRGRREFMPVITGIVEKTAVKDDKTDAYQDEKNN